MSASRGLPYLLLSAGVLAYLLYLFHDYVWIDSLLSIASDSANYLVMARHYTFWREEPLAIRQVWPLQDFPPLYPLLLALAGSAYSFLRAHILTSLTGLVSLGALYVFAARVFPGRREVILLVGLFALSPGYFLCLQGILSEPLFLLLSLAFLVLWQDADGTSSGRPVLAGLLLGMTVLTRTIGIALLLAVILQWLFARFGRKVSTRAVASVILTAVILYVLVDWGLGPERQSHYGAVLAGLFSGQLADYPSLSGTFVTQVHALLDAWRTFWLIYWLEGFSLTHVLAMVMLGCALYGLVLRLRRNHADAWYVLVYLLVLLIWPHPGQMVRLLYPVVPLMLVHAAYALSPIAARLLAPGYHARAGWAIFALLCAMVLPTHAFIHGRAGQVLDAGLLPVNETFRRLAPEDGMHEAEVQGGILDGFAALGTSTTPDDLILYFEPAYVALLSDRRSAWIPFDADARYYADLAAKSRASAIFLTTLHPRMTRKGYDGLHVAQYLDNWTELSWCSHAGKRRAAVSCLYRIGAGQETGTGNADKPAVPQAARPM